MTSEEMAYRASRAHEAANWAQILGPAAVVAVLLAMALVVALVIAFCRED